MANKKRGNSCWVRICPRCRSREVELRVIGDATSQTWACLSCGFQSPAFPEISLDDAKKLPERPVNFVQSRMPVSSGGIDKGVALALLLVILFWLIGSIF